MKNLIILFGLIAISFQSLAQTGTIKGNVKDANTGEAIIGASVVIQGTTIGNVTDVEGNFTISKVASGTHTIVVSFISYENKIIPNVTVQANKTTLINTALNESAQELQVVEVTATRAKNTEIAVLTEIKQAEQVAVGVSSQQISKSQDRDAAQVIRRVPGISIIDDRFVMVRGLSERYNSVLLNDVITPSMEVDVKSFSFDIIPSSAIDRLLIFKSGAGELPGEFAGGVIKIYTKNIPDVNSFSFGFSASYRNGTTFQNYSRYKPGKTDFLGFDDGNRSLPSGFPKIAQINGGTPNNDLIAKYKSMNPYFSMQESNAIPDIRMGLGFSRKFQIGGLRLSNITSINYSNTHQSVDSKSNRYLSYNADQKTIDTSQIFNDKIYSNSVRLGVLHNWALILNNNNRIEFRNLFNQMGQSETILRTGANVENGLDISNYSFRYESKSIYMGQLSGTHDLSDNTSVKWTGGYAYTFRQEPDYRRFASSRQRGATDAPFIIDVPVNSNASLTQAARFYSDLNESTGTFTANIENKFNLNGSSEEDLMGKIRGGIYVEQKAREFSARWFGYVNPRNSSKTSLAPSEFFDPSNINNTDGFYYSEGTNFDDKYSAQNLLGAGYVSAYLPFTSKFNASVGLRAEYNRQQLDSRQRGGGAKVNVDNVVIRPLPSVNVAYKFTDASLIRAAYSLTLNRPEFRELAPFTYYNFALDIGYVGNPKLKTPSIHNADLRWEFYPTESEIISVGAFYKKFVNPIEQIIRYAGSGISYTYGNAEYATSAGVEVEVRKTLVPSLTLLLNASLIKSEVELGDQFAGQDKNRPMMGQSPYLVNAGLYYNNQEKNIQVNVLYNVIGKRIFIVGDQLSGTIYEMPRNVLDLNFSKGITRNIEIKGGIQDLLNQSFRLIQDNNRDSKINDDDQSYQTFKRGSYFTLGVNFKL